MQERSQIFLEQLQEEIRNCKTKRYSSTGIIDVKLPGYFGYTHNLMKNSFENVWGTFEILGLKNKELNPEVLLHSIHPEDYNQFINHHKFVCNNVSKQWLNEKFEWTSSILFRLKKGDGTYSHIFKTSTILESYNNKIVKTINWCNDVTSMQLEKSNAAQVKYISDVQKTNLSKSPFHTTKTSDHFTAREVEIMENTKIGLTSKEIAKKLIISPYTVSKHKSNILAKTNCKSINEVIFKIKL